jgi:hypothetical protein
LKEKREALVALLLEEKYEDAEKMSDGIAIY